MLEWKRNQWGAGESLAACVRRTRYAGVAMLVAGGLLFAAPSQGKNRHHPMKCRTGYVRRTVRVAERKHGRIVRKHRRIVYQRVEQCVKIAKPQPIPAATAPPSTPSPPAVSSPAPLSPSAPPMPPPAPPVNWTPPQISGTAREDQTLSAAPGTWMGASPMAFAYQWQRCDAGGGSCQNVAGATNPAYLVSTADADSRLRVSVNASNAVESASEVSAVTGVVPRDPVVVAVGDIACAAGDTSNDCRQQATATLAADQHPDDVLVLGDNQYNSGLYSEYEGAGAYHATWGMFNPFVHPVPGNHEYTASSSAAGYFQYFGALAGPPPGYYSFNVGSWHIVALNSDCSDSGCRDQLSGDTSSAQTSWLQSDLAANRSACVLAFWHHPRFSSGFVGDSTGVGPLWTALYSAHADVVLNGHDHLYERYGQQDPSGNPTRNGIREFVVGTGGENLMPLTNPEPTLEASDTRDFGLLVLTLHTSSYDWAFKRTDGSGADSGTATCHGSGTTVISAASDIAKARLPRLTEPRLVFDARPLGSSLRAVAHRGLPVAIHCSRACDVVVNAWVRHGRHLLRIASFSETESEIRKPYSLILLGFPNSLFEGPGKVTLVLGFTALDATMHRSLLTRIVTLERG